MARTKRTYAENFVIKQIRATKRKIERRLANIEKAGLDSPALEKYKYKSAGKKSKLEYDEKLLKAKGRYYDTSVKGKNLTQLNRILNRLEQFDTLKTSSVAGAKHYTRVAKPLFVKIFSSDNYEKIFSLYDKLVEENLLIKNYKYEVLEVILENVELPEEKIREKVDDLLETLEAESQAIPHTTNISF